MCEQLVVAGAWWDLVDDLATRKIGPILAANRGAVTPYVRRWATADNRWPRRTRILVQLKHRDETDEGLLSYAIEQNLDRSDFFLRKGISWALREYGKTAPAWVEAFVDQ